MRLHICAVGRLASRTPEFALIADYVARADRGGRALSLGPVSIHEVDPKKPGMAAEADALRRAIPEHATLVCLDERGHLLSSPDLAARLEGWRDAGAQDLAFVIGGADGIDPGLRDTAALTLSFGRMVWPHMLARVMLAEQIYRATSILAGAPYHRA